MSTTNQPYDTPVPPASMPSQSDGLSTAAMAQAAEQGTKARQDNAPQPAEPMGSVPRRDQEQMRADQRRQPGQPHPDALLASDEANGFRARWDSIQTGFVDQPRQAVEQADALVAEIMKRLAETFAAERSQLEQRWSRGDNVSTEDLRVALQHYRAFFDRLLSV